MRKMLGNGPQWQKSKDNDGDQMSETVKAKWHRLVGGRVCAARARHNLMLVEYHWYERTGATHDAELTELRLTLHQMEHRSARRPMCTTCWQFPGD